jgi:hypothetical protein
VINQTWRMFRSVLMKQKVAKFVLLGAYSILAIVASSATTDSVSQMVGLLSMACIGFALIFNLSDKDTDTKYIITILVSVFVPLVLLVRMCFLGLGNIPASNNFHYQTLCVILFIQFLWFFAVVFFDDNQRDMVQKLNDLFKKS